MLAEVRTDGWLGSVQKLIHIRKAPLNIQSRRIEDLMDELKGAKYFSKIDLRSIRFSPNQDERRGCILKAYGVI